MMAVVVVIVIMSIMIMIIIRTIRYPFINLLTQQQKAQLGCTYTNTTQTHKKEIQQIICCLNGLHSCVCTC